MSIASKFEVCHIGGVYLHIKGGIAYSFLDNISEADRCKLVKTKAGDYFTADHFRQMCIRAGRIDVVGAMDASLLFQPLSIPDEIGIALIRTPNYVAAASVRYHFNVLRAIHSVGNPSSLEFIPTQHPKSYLNWAAKRYGLICNQLDGDLAILKFEDTMPVVRQKINEVIKDITLSKRVREIMNQGTDKLHTRLMEFIRSDDFKTLLEIDEAGPAEETGGPSIGTAVAPDVASTDPAEPLEKLIVVNPAKFRDQINELSIEDMIQMKCEISDRSQYVLEWFGSVISSKGCEEHL